jgi:hypothetical protein
VSLPNVTLTAEEFGMVRAVMHRQACKTIYLIECMVSRNAPREDVRSVCEAAQLAIGLLLRMDSVPTALRPEISDLSAKLDGFRTRLEAQR